MCVLRFIRGACVGNLSKKDFLELESMVERTILNWLSDRSYKVDHGKPVEVVLSELRNDVDWFDDVGDQLYVVDMANFVLEYAIENKIEFKVHELEYVCFMIDMHYQKVSGNKKSLYVDELVSGFYGILYSSIRSEYGLYTIYPITNISLKGLLHPNHNFGEELKAFGIDESYVYELTNRMNGFDIAEWCKNLFELPEYKRATKREKGDREMDSCVIFRELGLGNSLKKEGTV